MKKILVAGLTVVLTTTAGAWGAGEARAQWDVGAPTELAPFDRLGLARATGVSGSTIVGWMQELLPEAHLRARAVHWDTGEAGIPVHTLPDLGDDAEAGAVSGSLVVGQASDPLRGGATRPVFWDLDEPGSPVHVLPDVGSPAHRLAGSPRATGASGTRIVGLIAIPGTDQLTAAFWDTAEPGTPVHVLPTFDALWATANSVSGTLIVGTSGGRAVFWDAAEPGTPAHALPDLGGANVAPAALGVSGTLIVGLVGDPSSPVHESLAVYWDTAEPGTPVHVLPDLNGPISGGIATGVSGSRIVGQVFGSDGQRRPVFWDTAELGIPAHALPTLGGPFQPPSGVSGTLIVGQAQDAIGNEAQAVFWNAAEAGSPVHVLPGSVKPIGGVQALGVSETLVVGQALDPSRIRAVMWDTAEPGSPPHALPDLGGFVSNVANGVSGTTIVGQAAADPVTFRTVAVSWSTDEPGLPVHVLPDLGGDLNKATGVSGAVIVGQAEDSTRHHRAVFWDASEPGNPVHVLPDLGGEFFAGGTATAVSGTLIVGRAFNPAFDRASPVFWDTAEPGRPAHVLPDLGIFAQANGVSGTVIVGEEHGPTGQPRAVFWDLTEAGSPVHVLPDFGRTARANGISGTLIVGEADDPTGRPRAVFWDLASLGNAPTVLPDPGSQFAIGRATAVSGTRIAGQPGALVWDLVPNFIRSFTARSTLGGTPLVGVPVAFEATVDDAVVGVRSVEWDFDGNGMVDETTTTLTNEHTYTTAGSFPASVRIVTDDGAEASAVTTVTVVQASVTINGFTAAWTAGSAPLVGAPVTFEARVDDSSRVSSVEWDFDGNGTVDETTTTLTNDHTYTTAGSFPATVTVVAREGGRTSATAEVTVLTASQAIETARWLVQQLPLKAGQVTALASKLDDAQKALTRGNIPGACTKLSEVADHVQRLIRTGQLSSETAAPVLDELRAVEISLACQ